MRIRYFILITLLLLASLPISCSPFSGMNFNKPLIDFVTIPNPFDVLRNSKVISRRVFAKFLYENSAIFQGLLLPTIASAFSKEQYVSILRQCFIRTKPDAGLVASYRLAIDDIRYEHLGVQQRIAGPVRNCLVALGIQKSKALPDVSPFQELIERRYQIRISDWRPFLKREYNHARRVLALSDMAFEMNRSSWMCLTDSLNEILIRTLIKKDRTIKQKLAGDDGKLVKYGSLLNNSGFKATYGLITNVFFKVHKRRCSIPEAHPYDEQTLKRTTFLRLGEQRYYYGQLKRAYLDYDRALLQL